MFDLGTELANGMPLGPKEAFGGYRVQDVYDDFVCLPLEFRGGTGSWARPIAAI